MKGLLVVLAIAALPAFAEEEQQLQRIPLSFPCLNAECTHAAVPSAVLDMLEKTNREIATELAAARAERDKLRDKCVAKLEVVPVPPPAKKTIPVDPKTLNRS